MAPGLTSIHVRRRQRHQGLLYGLAGRKIDPLRIPFQAAQVVEVTLEPGLVIGYSAQQILSRHQALQRKTARSGRFESSW